MIGEDYNGNMVSTGVFQISDNPERPIALQMSLEAAPYQQAGLVRAFSITEAKALLVDLDRVIAKASQGSDGR